MIQYITEARTICRKGFELKRTSARMGMRLAFGTEECMDEKLEMISSVILRRRHGWGR